MGSSKTAAAQRTHACSASVLAASGEQHQAVVAPRATRPQRKLNHTAPAPLVTVKPEPCGDSDGRPGADGPLVYNVKASSISCRRCPARRP
jgi:hypothetical protein